MCLNEPRRFFFTIALLLGAIAVLGAQDFRFSRLSREDGLSDPSVSSIAQDSRGFLWFGTKNGLNRYDGYDFVVYSNDPFNEKSLSDNQIRTLFMDSNDILWIGTKRGLNRFDTGSRRFTRFVSDPANPASLSNDVVTAVHRDHAGILWVGTLAGLNALDERTGSFRRYRAGEEGSMANDAVRSLLETQDGTLWVGTYGGLLRFDRASDTFARFCRPSAFGERDRAFGRSEGKSLGWMLGRRSGPRRRG